MGKEIMVTPLPDLLFDKTKIQPLFTEIDSVECKKNKDLKHTNSLYFYNFEMGSTVVFYQKGKLRSHNILELPISSITSAEVSSAKKMIGKKWILTIKTSKETIVVHAQEKQVNAFKKFLNGQKNKQTQANETKKITFTVGGSTKTLNIHPYSPEAQDGEDHLFSVCSNNLGFLITNYRVFMDDFLSGNDSKVLTHGEYEDVIASNVEKRREEDIVGGVEETPSLITSFLSGMGKAHYYNVSYNKSTHHS